MHADAVSAATIRILTPELIVVLAATFIYVAGAFLPNRKFWGILGVASIIAAGCTLIGQYNHLFWPHGATEPVLAVAVGGPLAVDMLGLYVRLLALVVGAVFVLLVTRPPNEELIPEIVGTVMMAVAGLMLVGGARDLTLLFLGLELISIPTYVLLFLGRRDGASAESAAKYFFLSILSSGITLYGFSFLYGVGGSTRLDHIQAALAKASALAESAPLYAQLALVLIVAGLGFKIAAVPFHFYAPDVYQGTTNPNAGILAVLPKIAGIAALVRVVSVAMPGTEETGVRILMIVSILTMTLGNVVALWQDDIRRMMAYSSIAHAGYMLVGLAVDASLRTKGMKVENVDGVAAALFYVAAYSLATGGLFAALTYLGGRDRSIDKVDDLAGVGRANPFAAICGAIFLFSLAGLPPLPGFWGKFALFSGAVKVGLAGDPKLSGWFIALAVIGMLNAAVAAAYYLRLVGAMFFRPAEGPAPTAAGSCRLAATVICLLLSLWISFGPGELSTASGGASQSARPVVVTVAPPAVAQK